MVGDRLWGADRYVLYLPEATRSLTDLDGSREQRIRQAVEKFLGSPDSAADKQPAEFIWHIRDLDTKTRAFATWCQNKEAGVSVLIVQDIYRKSNEDDYWVDLNEYNAEGEQFEDQFSALSSDNCIDWLESVADRMGHILVGHE